MSLPGNKLLIVAAHMDDEVLGCGGLLARCASEGVAATVLICAYPSLSFTNAAVPSSEYAQWRQATIDCCNVLECAVEFLPHSQHFLRDESLWRDEEKLRQLIEAHINKYEYDWLIGHDGRDYHQDHRLLYNIMAAALRPFATTVNHYWTMDVPGSSSPASVPEIFVPLTAMHMALREAAYGCYEPLVGRHMPHPRSMEAWRARAVYRGSQCGAAFAETFALGHAVI